MPTENKVAPNIQLALDYSRNFATAKPNIGLTEKEHIEGLANLLERTALENSGLQQRLTAADERNDEAIDLLRRARAVIEGGGWADLERDIAKFFKPAEGGGDEG
jgi:hypothetical protein